MNETELSKQMFSCYVIKMSGQLNQFYNYQIFEKDKKISELLRELKQINNEIQKLKATISFQISLAMVQNLTIHQQEQEIDIQKLKKDLLQNLADKVKQTIGAEAQFRKELEHLRAENQVY
ncbi:unnamed protein product [Paramecium sonneborni]|uniref:Uncharacterized protein n=1 Tax=Paramecium sonneborni TaxID=65129 RepID=A0A8S1MY52_9CILI|nr:unnamed protein product [Paramecium sonneborni]